MASIVAYILKSGAVRPLIVTQVHEFGPPEPDKPGQTVSNAIWDRRHEGIVDGVVVLDPKQDQPGPLGLEAIAGLFVSVADVAFDASGKPGTWNNGIEVPLSSPPSPSPEFMNAQADAAARRFTLAQAREINAQETNSR